jgi:hypothetical protein
MSTFDGVDLFGSGPHQIIVGGEIVTKKRSGYAGVSGLASMTMGGRGWPIQITGILSAATRAALNTLIGDIEDAANFWGECTLTDSEGNYYYYVELDGIQITGPVQYYTGGCMVRYIVTGAKLY